MTAVALPLSNYLIGLEYFTLRPSRPAAGGHRGVGAPPKEWRLSQTKETKEPKDAKGGKPRVYVLANELDLDTKTVLEFCKELGYGSIKNQLSSLEPDQVDAV